MANTPINIIGNPGTAGTNGANPTPGGKGQNAPFTLNGTIGTNSTTINAKGGKGGKGGNGGTHPGANGGDGGDASITVNGNIFNAPTTTTMAILATSTGGDGGAPGTGTPPGTQGNGGNAAVTMNGNIIQTSKTMSDVELNAQAVGGVGSRYGNATATLSGNILQPTKATTATLEAAAFSNPATSMDSIAHDGDPNFGTKTATVSGNVVQGNITNVNLFADAYYSNASANIMGNIVSTTATSGTVTLEATGQHIDIEQNKINVAGTDTVALTINEFGPAYDVTIKGNDFEGTGKNTFVFTDLANPGPSPNTAVIDLSNNSFMFDGKNNKLKGFTNVTLGGNETDTDTLTGDSNNNILTGGSGNDFITGGGGNDTIDGGAGAFDTAAFTGAFAQYTVALSQVGNLAGTVTDHVAGRDGTDTLKNVEFLKFSDGIFDVVAGHFIPNDHAPVANNDAYTTAENTALIVPAVAGVLANDTDADADPLTSILVANPTHGALTLNPNGSFTYTPTAGFHGTDSFTYKANDGTLDSNNATVTLTITDHAPVAVNDAYATGENTPLTVPALGVLTNDTDADADPLTAVLVTNVTHGALTLNPNGSFTYTPTAGFHGTDSFTYQANDGALNSNTATVTLTINDHAPIAVNDAYSTGENTPLTVPTLGVLTNDTDADADPLTAVLVTNVTHGALTLNPNGSFTYNPTAGFHGTDSFTYQANDGTLNSNTATVTLTINDHAPVANNDAFNTFENTPLTVPALGVLTNDTDADADPLTAVLVTNTTHGAVTLNPNGSFTYTPTAGFHGTDSFTYQANDGTLNSNTATVTLTVNDHAPVANNDTFNTTENTPLTVAAAGVLANDTDADGDPLTAAVVTNPTHGALTLNPNGSFTYTPTAGYRGADSFTYQANDGTLNSNTATVTLNINDNAPVAVNDSYTFSNASPLGSLSVPAAMGVLKNDTDADGDPLTVTPLSNGAHGNVTLNFDGSFTYTPFAGGTSGTDSFTYRVNDGTLNSNIATVNLTYHATDNAPVAVDDSYTTPENTSLHISAAAGVLTNDTDVDGDSLIVTNTTAPTHGSVSVNPDGSFTYNPTAGFHGTDSFTYRVNDGTANSNFATVHLTVTNPNNHAPVANNDSFNALENTPLNIPAAGVLTNDTDADADPLTAAVVANPTHGALTLNPDGSFTYTPTAGYRGPDSFTYKANDGMVDSNTATVTLTVNDNAPVANNDSFTTAAGTPLTIPAAGVLSNDTDADGDPLTAALVTNPTHGSLTLNADGSFTYNPTAGFHGTDSFTYKANDGTLNSNTATVNLTITDHAPVAVNDSYTFSNASPLGSLSVPAAMGVLKNDTDADGDPLTVTPLSNGAHGNVTLNFDGSFTYTPFAGGTSGTDSFTYRVNDGTLNSNIATVNLTYHATDNAPVAVDDSYTTPENTSLHISAAAGVLTNDTDVDGDSLIVTNTTAPTHGSVSVNPDGSFTYNPTAGYTGTDSFTYRVNDGTANSNFATVHLNIGDHAPVANNDAYSTAAGTSLTVPAAGVLSNDTDADADPLTAAVVANPTHGTLGLNADGSFTYTPTAGFHGTDSFTYQANDGTLNSNTATVTLTVTDHAPVAVNDAYNIGENTPLIVGQPLGVQANDTDADGDTLTSTVVAGPAHGSLTLNPNGSFTYNPDAGFHGTDNFTYRDNDGTLNSNTAAVNLTIVDHAPVAVNDSFTTAAGTPLTVPAAGVLANDTDADGDPLTAALVGPGPTHGTLGLNADGSFTYTPTAGFHGTDSFTYQANDGTLNSNTATVNLTITDNAPVAADDSYTTDENTPLTVLAATGVQANDTDPDLDPLTSILVANAANGNVTLNPDGSFTYTPNANYFGPDSFTYKDNDGTLDSNTATVNLTVNKFPALTRVSDLDGNGKGDLVFQNGGAIQIRTNPGSVNQTPNITGVGNFTAVATGLFTSSTNHNASILLQKNAGARDLEILTQTTGAATPTLITTTPGAGWVAIDTGDFNGDGTSDILLQKGGNAEIMFTTGTTGTTGALASTSAAFAAPVGYTAVSSGDFDGNGKSDILWSNGTSVEFTLMNGAATVSNSGAIADSGMTVIGTGDFNGDGKSDILFQNGTQAVVWTMNGNAIGTTTTFNQPTAAGTWSVVGAEDLDGNGASDIIWHDSVAGNTRATMMTAPGVGANPLVAPTVLAAQQNFGAPNQNFTLVASSGGG